jgi:hypothetical protein
VATLALGDESSAKSHKRLVRLFHKAVLFEKSHLHPFTFHDSALEWPELPGAASYAMERDDNYAHYILTKL